MIDPWSWIIRIWYKGVKLDLLKCVLFEKSPKNLNFLTFFSGGKFKLQKNERTYKIFDDFSNKMHFNLCEKPFSISTPVIKRQA